MMHTLGFRRAVAGAALAVAIAGASFSAVLFSGGDSSPARKPVTTESERASTSTTTSTTTTTTVPPLTSEAEPAPEPAPAPTPAPVPLNFAPAPEPEPAPEPIGCGGGGGVVGAHNGDRAAAGLGGLCESGQLAGFAQNWANQMASMGSLVHQDIGGLIGSTGFSNMGENILVGPANLSPAQMESAWMNSPSHRANILSGAFTQVGVGVAYGDDGRMWVCVDFGG
jgi:uncharacterized protein YkwD